MRHRLFYSLTALLPLLACAPRPSRQIQPPADEQGTPESAPSSSKTHELTRLSSLDEASLRAFLDRWLAAQNTGDWPAYEALYAERFVGVRRSGDDLRLFDRTGWMKDRRRMFDESMAVEVAQLKLSPGHAEATLRFVQRFAAGDYLDVGAKQLAVVLKDGLPRIGVEQMLSSNVQRSAAGRHMAIENFMFVVAGEYVVLRPGSDPGFDDYSLEMAAEDLDVTVPSSPSIGHEAPSFARGGALVAQLSDARIRREMQAWLGQKVRVSIRGGGWCMGHIEDFALVTEANAFALEDDMDEEELRDIAGWTWPGSTVVHLAGRVRFAEPNDCAAEARFAQLDRGKAPAVLYPVDSPAWAARGLAAFRELAEHRRLQAEFLAQGGAGIWDEMVEDPEVQVFRWADDSGHLVVVQAHATRLCEGSPLSRPGLSAGIYFDASGRRLDGQTRELDFAGDELEALVDLDGDGQVEWLMRTPIFTHRSLLASDGRELRTLPGVWDGCPC